MAKNPHQKHHNNLVFLDDYRRAKIRDIPRKESEGLRRALRLRRLYGLIKENKATPGQIEIYQHLKEYFKRVYPEL